MRNVCSPLGKTTTLMCQLQCWCVDAVVGLFHVVGFFILLCTCYQKILSVCFWMNTLYGKYVMQGVELCDSAYHQPSSMYYCTIWYCTFVFILLYSCRFDNWFPMFGAMSYGLFALYLEACTVTGCFKVGLRYSVCVCVALGNIV